MDGLPPANFARLASAQQLRVGTARTTQTNHAHDRDQQRHERFDMREYNVNIGFDRARTNQSAGQSTNAREKMQYGSQRRDTPDNDVQTMGQNEHATERENRLYQRHNTTESDISVISTANSLDEMSFVQEPTRERLPSLESFEMDEGRHRPGQDKRTSMNQYNAAVRQVAPDGRNVRHQLSYSGPQEENAEDNSFRSLRSNDNSFYSSSGSLDSDHSAGLCLSSLPTRLCQQPLQEAPSTPSQSLPPNPVRTDTVRRAQLHEEQMKKLQIVCNHPESVIWRDGTKTCVLLWNEEGKLGFHIRDVKSKDGSKNFAMVIKVNRGSPAHLSGLKEGEHVLSVNGIPTATNQQDKASSGTSTLLKEQSRENPVTLIVRKPKRLKTSAKLKTSVRQDCSVDVHRNGDDTPLDRLPHLRLVIMGFDAESIAEQLIGSEIWSERQEEPISTRCHVTVKKMDAGIKIENKTSSSGGSPTDEECVDLDVLVVRNATCPVADYCSQLMMTSHCIYVIGFDGHSYLGNPDSTKELQMQLNKIRTYASRESPVYLVSTWQNKSSVNLEEMQYIGQNIDHRFGAAFHEQLQYHENCPCFVLSKSSQVASGSSAQHSQSCNTSVNPRGFYPERLSNLLREHILVKVFDQNFVTWNRKPYPKKFLLFRDIVIRMRKDQKQKFVLTSLIEKECGITDPLELGTFLEYLHRQGVIILPGNQKGDSPSVVSLNPEDLIPICKALLEIPEVSRQDQFIRRHWSDLQRSSELSQALLTHVLNVKSDVGAVTQCLLHLNLIYAYPPGDIYLVPFPGNRAAPSPTDRFSERLLLADFNGYCPHGLFSKLAIGLSRIAKDVGGSSRMNDTTSWDFHMGGDYSVYMDEEQRASRIKFMVLVMERKYFMLPQVLREINSALLKVIQRTDGYTLGPPCPICECQRDSQNFFDFPHIIDLSKNSGERPLLCGSTNLIEYISVGQWIDSQSRGVPPGRSFISRSIHRSTPWRELPPDLVHAVSQMLTTAGALSVGKGWKNLAGLLQYEQLDVEKFGSPYPADLNPCEKLLSDWASRDNPTLGDLLGYLGNSGLGRNDIIDEVYKRWRVSGNHYLDNPV